MNETVAEWVSKAEGDWRVANREFLAEDNPNFDAVCFHAQQCIEKLMKGLLIDKGVIPPKTHSLIALNHLLMSTLPSWSADIEDLRLLTYAAREFRYPGETASRTFTESCLQAAAPLRDRLLKLVAAE